MKPEQRNTPIDNLDPATLLASPRLAQWLLAALGALTISVLLPLVVSGPGAGEAAHHFASDSLLLALLYLMLAGSLVACMQKRWKSVARRMGAEPKPRLRPAAETVVMPIDFDAATAEQVLRSAGYRCVQRGDGWVWGLKNRWSPLGTIVLHFAVLVGLLAAAVGALPGVDSVEHARVRVGARASLPLEAGELTVTRLDARHAEADTLASLTARAVVPSGRTVTLRTDMPTLIGPATAVVAEDYDLAPRFSLLATDAATARPATVAAPPLRLRRAGAADRMVIGHRGLGSYRLTLRANTELPSTPTAMVERRIRGRWRLVYSERALSPGDRFRVGRAWLRYDGMERWASLRVHRAPSAPLTALAIVLAVVGSCARLIFPRVEATVAARPDSTVAATVSIDAYRGSRSASALIAERLVDE